MKNITQITMLALAISLASGCSDEAPAPKPQEKEKTELQKKHDEIFNPSPEQKAAQEAERNAALPLTNELEELPKAPREQYTSMDDPLMPMRLYTAHRNWEEKAELVADDLQYLRPQVGVPTEFSDLTVKYKKVENAFDKADLAKAIDSFAKAEAAKLNGNRLVKVDLNRQAGIMPYDMDSQTFTIDTSLFTDKLTYTDAESRSVGRERLPPVKGHLYNGGVEFRYTFTGATSLETVKVEDTAIARSVEGARQNAKLVVYGYVKRTQRKHLKGVPYDNPHLYIQPHFVDIVDQGGNVLHTIEL